MINDRNMTGSILRHAPCSSSSPALILPATVQGMVWAVEEAPPNILLIYTDDHSAAAVGCYGSRINSTPNIDRIAREGLRFDNAFCTNAICAPCRAVVLTGVHSHLNGLMDNGDVFDGSQPTFPQLLQGAGYQTALIGKWHLKTDPTGFDSLDCATLAQGGVLGIQDFITSDGLLPRDRVGM